MGRFFGWIALACVCGLTLFSRGEAGLQIEPECIKIEGAQGGAYLRTIEIANTSSEAQEFRLEPDYWYRGGVQASLDSWFFLSERVLRLAPKSRCEIRLSVKVPEQLQGECMVMIFFARAQVSPGVTLMTRTGIPVYVCARRTSRRSAEWVSLSFDPGGKPAMELELKNTGNVHLLPFGVIELQGPEPGSETYQQEVRFLHPVFPGEIGKVEIAFPAKRNMPTGSYRFEMNVFLENLYTGTLETAPQIVKKGELMHKAEP